VLNGAGRIGYLNNRYYDPVTGEFLSVDPLVTSTGDPYLYAGGNPTTLSDPTGLCTEGNGRCQIDYTGDGPTSEKNYRFTTKMNTFVHLQVQLAIRGQLGPWGGIECGYVGRSLDVCLGNLQSAVDDVSFFEFAEVKKAGAWNVTAARNYVFNILRLANENGDPLRAASGGRTNDLYSAAWPMGGSFTVGSDSELRVTYSYVPPSARSKADGVFVYQYQRSDQMNEQRLNEYLRVMLGDKADRTIDRILVPGIGPIPASTPAPVAATVGEPGAALPAVDPAHVSGGIAELEQWLATVVPVDIR
jgi:hypothetical protein